MPTLRLPGRKEDPVRIVLRGYGLHSSGSKAECLARLAHHMQEHPGCELGDESPELELAAQQLRKWYSRGTGLSINSTWFLGGERLRTWQHGTAILHTETERTERSNSMHARDGDGGPPSLSVLTEGLNLDPRFDRTLSVESPDNALEALEASPRVGFLPSPKSLRSPRAFLQRAMRSLDSPKTPMTPRTPGGSLVKLLFEDV